MRAPRFLSLAVVAALAACNGDDDDGPTPIPYADDGKLTVMSRNLYLGAELNDIIAATSTVELRAATTAAWEQALANDFGARAQALADEVAEALPDVIGLQEVSLWRIQVPGDFGTALSRPAETVAIDHLAILLEALRQRGLSYVVAAEIDLFDQEVPINARIATDVRLTDRQVILAREGVPVSNAQAQVFPAATLLQLPILGFQTPVLRGWTRIDAQIGGRTVTVVNTHLEAFDPRPRVGQAVALAATLEAETGPVALVGDLNSPPVAEEAVPTPPPATVPSAYAVMTAQAGFQDAFAAVGAGEGLTCCFDPDLSQPRETRDLETRIDYTMWRGPLVAESSLVMGAADADRTASGLWPSDHAGVVTTFAFAP